MSPFIDVDFLEYAFKIPLKYRKNYFLTINWMTKKYPEAAKYNWQTKRMPVNYYKEGRLYFPKVYSDIKTLIKRSANKVCKELGIHWRAPLNDDMIPFDSWYENNEEFRSFFREYFYNGIDLVTEERLKQDVLFTFEHGNARDKMQAVDIVSLFKLYFAG